MKKKKGKKKRVKKKLVVTAHIQDRMRQRKVSLEDIKKTIAKPNYKTPISVDKCQEYRRNVNGKTHFVVVGVNGTNLILITTGWSQNE